MKLRCVLTCSLLLAATTDAQQSPDYSSSFGLAGQNKTFDYVIVGGGLTGLVTALRLTETGRFSIALVEAGGFYEVDGGNVSVIPAYESEFLESPPTIDWKIYTTNQPGRTFGGGTARNGMALHRSTKGAYQHWADIVGDQSFSFDGLTPYFQKGINFTSPNQALRGGPKVAYNASAFSPSGGPLHVSFWNYYIPASGVIRRGLERLGFKETSQIQSGSLFGFAQFPATMTPDTQERDSAQTSYLNAAISNNSQSSLQIYANTLAKKIIFGTNKTATGVYVDTAGFRYTLSARKEVILAAGVFRTPQLLMVSGIGPKSTLRSFQIKPVATLEGVGKNMMDNPGFANVQPINAVSQHRLWNNATYIADAYKQYYQSRSGPFTAFASNYILWENYPTNQTLNISSTTRQYLSSFPKDWPDVEYIFNAAGAPTNTSGDMLAVGVVVLKASSRGSVTINSTDTAQNPLVDVNWFGTNVDRELGIAGLRRIRQFIIAANIAAGPEQSPGPQVQTDEQILAWIKTVASPSHHAVGTCAMGPANATDSVVDSRGLVRGGVKNLRIVDASILPILPPGQPMGTLYPLAEKLAAEIIKAA